MSLLMAASFAVAAAEPGLALTGSTFNYTVRTGDSLTGVGARFGVEARLLAKANRLSASAWLRPEQVLTVDNRHIAPAGLPDGILVNIPQRMLFHFIGGALQAAYPVALGRPDWPTPEGAFDVVSREQGKTWFVPPSIQREMREQGQEVKTSVPPGPDNPLGNHWLGLSLPGYGIHGTIAPQSIYSFQSHGCIRLHPDDAAALFDAVRKGDAGVLIYQPVLLFGAPDRRVYLEVHRDIYKKGLDANALARELADTAGVSERIDWKKAAAVVAARDGIARDVTQDNDEDHHDTE